MREVHLVLTGFQSLRHITRFSEDLFFFIFFLGSRCAVHGSKNALRSKGFVSRCLTNEKPYCEMRSVMFPAGL